MSQRSIAIGKERRGKKLRKNNLQFLAILVIGVSLVGWLIWNASRGTQAPKIQRFDRIGTQLGEIAPDFTVSTLDNGEFSLGAHRGNPTIIFFMAYWCGTCIPEAQALVRLNEEYGDDLNIIAIDIDPSSSVDALNQFKLASGNGAFIWAFDIDQLVTNSYRVRALDTTLVLDADGYIVYQDERPTDYKTLKNALESLEP